MLKSQAQVIYLKLIRHNSHHPLDNSYIQLCTTVRHETVPDIVSLRKYMIGSWKRKSYAFHS